MVDPDRLRADLAEIVATGSRGRWARRFPAAWRSQFPYSERTGSSRRSGSWVRRAAAVSPGGRGSRDCCRVRPARSRVRWSPDFRPGIPLIGIIRSQYLTIHPVDLCSGIAWTCCHASRLSRGRMRRCPIDERLQLAATVPPSSVDGEWYLVAFRSVRAAGADEAGSPSSTSGPIRRRPRHRASSTTSRGPERPTGSCLSFCLWQSRADARAAAGQALSRSRGQPDRADVRGIRPRVRHRPARGRRTADLRALSGCAPTAGHGVQHPQAGSRAPSCRGSRSIPYRPSEAGRPDAPRRRRRRRRGRRPVQPGKRRRARRSR